jgi:hypothetical protein
MEEGMTWREVFHKLTLAKKLEPEVLQELKEKYKHF